MKRIYLAILILGLSVSAFSQRREMIINKRDGSKERICMSGIDSLTFNLRMVLVAGGSFLMGSTTGDDNEAPVHSVTVGSFHMDRTEITYEQWTEVYTWGRLHGYTDICLGHNGYGGSGSNQPITKVTWYDVVMWCNARSEKDGFEPVYYTDNTLVTVYRSDRIDLNTDAVKWTANGYRLPTEAEWEFAARGGTKSNGYTYSGSNTLDSVAWYYPNSDCVSHTVATKSANELGIYDMSGNVGEWCWDWYGAYTSVSQSDPKGATTGSSRVYRGSLFDDLDDYSSRVAFRPGTNPFNAYNELGFRCAQN